jgi:hypothetical protein
MLGVGPSVLRLIRSGALITTTSNYTSEGFNNDPIAIAQSFRYKGHPNSNKMLMRQAPHMLK